MKKKVVDGFKSLGQMKNLNAGPLMQYNGDPEGVVKAKPGSLCVNMNYGTDGTMVYKKVLGHGDNGWSPLYGGSPRVMTVHVAAIAADGDKIFFVAPEDMVVKNIMVSCGNVNTLDDTTNYIGFNVKNYTGIAADHSAFGLEMLATDKLVQEGWDAFTGVDITPDQNRFVKAGRVLELLFDETGTVSLSNVVFTVHYYPSCCRSDSACATIGAVSDTDEAVTEGFLVRVPKDGFVEGITVTSSASAASDDNDFYDIQVTNKLTDGTGTLTLCSTAHNTNSDTDITAYTATSLVIDQNQDVLEGELLMITFTATKDAGLTALADCVVTVDMTLYDSEDVGAIQTNTNGNRNIGTLTDEDELITLFVAPFDCKVRNIFLTTDTIQALHATIYLEAQVYRFKKVNYPSAPTLPATDPHYDLMSSEVITTKTGEDGAVAIAVDAPWPTFGNAAKADGSDLVLADQNLNLKKGEVVKLHLTAVGAVPVDTDYSVVHVEIEDWDPDQVGLTRTDNR